jgi:TrkA-C domain
MNKRRGNQTALTRSLGAQVRDYLLVQGQRRKLFPIYEALLERELARDGPLPDLQTPVVLEYTLQEGARFEGKQVHELGLPDGCVLVALRRGLTEIVPTLHTRLDAGDRLTAVIASQAPEALAMLREGCKSQWARDE